MPRSSPIQGLSLKSTMGAWPPGMWAKARSPSEKSSPGSRSFVMSSWIDRYCRGASASKLRATSSRTEAASLSVRGSTSETGMRPRCRRAEVVAADLAASFAAHPVMCDLISAQAGVLEHNVSTEIAAEYKRAALSNLDGFATLLRSVVPELGEDGAARAASLIIVLVGALWTHTHPAPAMVAAIQADPALAAFMNDFAGELTAAIRVTLCGLLAEAESAVQARPPATSQ